MSGAEVTPFGSVLVANRGEIAVRIMATARRMGLQVIGVYTDAEVGAAGEAAHVARADRAVRIGAGPVEDSYLSVAALLQAARQSGAEAVHPGYGFLSERAAFCRAVQAAGLVFVGPSPAALELMADKAAARRRVAKAGVPLIPGYDGQKQTPAHLARVAARIGYPVMIKAALGGGGRGMRRVAEAVDFAGALRDARAEARAAFGDTRMIIERALEQARHVEVQIVADRQGRMVHLGVRDCSIQRRQQKLIEESPPPGVSPALQEALAEAALTVARAVGCEGVGTVEFLLEDSGDFYFLEMNPRLQVEHPVTEAITGLDLVALQFRLAAGRPLGLTQQDIHLRGHAIQARLYAENPAADFRPASGQITRWRAPEGPGLRVDAGLHEGQEVLPYFDPLLGKLISHGDTRELARQRLIRALEALVLCGPISNRSYLRDVLSLPEFVAGHMSTRLVERRHPDLLDRAQRIDPAEVALAAALLYWDRQARAAEQAVSVSPELLGWGSPGALCTRIELKEEGSGTCFALDIRDEGAHAVLIRHDGRSYSLWRSDGEGAPVYRVDGLRVTVTHVEIDRPCPPLDRATRLTLVTPQRDRVFVCGAAPEASRKQAAGGRVLAPMHGTLAEICVTRGQRLEAGVRLLVLEAMKMQHPLCAPIAGRVSHVHEGVGRQVRTGDLLVEIDPEG